MRGFSLSVFDERALVDAAVDLVGRDEQHALGFHFFAVSTMLCTPRTLVAMKSLASMMLRIDVAVGGEIDDRVCAVHRLADDVGIGDVAVDERVAAVVDGL